MSQIYSELIKHKNRILTNSGRHIDELDRMFPSFGETSRIIISCHKADYSASRIAHAVEDADAHLLNLNITTGCGSTAGTSPVTYVDLRIDRADPSSVARSLERYGYTVEYITAQSNANLDTMRERVNEILHYLEI